MAEVVLNREYWGNAYDWPERGDEWSAPWGNPRNQWWGTIVPRIHPFVPAGTILEIAPGFGRWTQFLKDQCDRLVAVDLNANCIEACRGRFASAGHIEYHVNDGRSLAMVGDGSVDLVFSFDSLVHADAEVLRAYLEQIAAKLAPDGVGFIHHSNVAAYLDGVRRLPRAIARHLDWRINNRVNGHWRSTEVSAERFAALCEGAGLRAIHQECVNWRGRHLIDCFSTFTRRGSAWDRPTRRFDNPRFMEEADRLKRSPSTKGARDASASPP